ncbi:MAG TPA: tetratricopeptide repeat protein [Candidatus Kapabacteria bacterium]|jgi:tetratricopeptide (TPR) repeat protein/DNA-binding CsgD family transcriptional regulator|nr:tetratricopeptide repeat protein [Candidatus Kapabacteria bacterium]
MQFRSNVAASDSRKSDEIRFDRELSRAEWCVERIPREAVERASGCVGLAEQNSDDPARARALLVSATAHLHLSNYAVARDEFETARKIFEAHGDARGVARAIAGFGNACWCACGYAEAHENQKVALSMFEALEDAYGIALCTVLIGRTLVDLGHLQAARETVDVALELSQELDDCYVRMRALGLAARVQSELGNRQRSLELDRAALALAEENDFRVEVLRHVMNSGDDYQGLGRYDEAMVAHQRAVVMAQELGCRRFESIATGNIADLFRELGDHERALRYFWVAARISQEIGCPCGAAFYAGEIGRLYEEIDELGMALAHFESEMAQGDDRRSNVAQHTGDIGVVHFRLGDYSGALARYESALATCEQIGEQTRIALWLGRIGQLYSTRAFNGYSPKRAEDCFARAMTISSEHGFSSHVAQIHRWLAQLNEDEERYREAYEHLKQHLAIREEIKSHEAHRLAQQFEHRQRIAEVERQHVIQQAEAQAAAARAELLEERLTRQQQELAMTALSLARQTDLLARFRNELRAIIASTISNDPTVRAVREKLKELPCESIDWTRFEAEFQQTFPEFRGRLLERHPSLSKTEVKICSLLKLRLTTMDIAQLLCASDRSIDWHRSNIRKKLGLQPRDDLSEAMQRI